MLTGPISGGKVTPPFFLDALGFLAPPIGGAICNSLNSFDPLFP